MDENVARQNYEFWEENFASVGRAGLQKHFGLFCLVLRSKRQIVPLMVFKAKISLNHFLVAMKMHATCLLGRVNSSWEYNFYDDDNDDDRTYKGVKR